LPITNLDIAPSILAKFIQTKYAWWLSKVSPNFSYVQKNRIFNIVNVCLPVFFGKNHLGWGKTVSAFFLMGLIDQMWSIFKFVFLSNTSLVLLTLLLLWFEV
jgi:hypothetical protein